MQTAAHAHGGGIPAHRPTIELGELLHEYHLGLVLIAGAGEETPGLPVQWVHVSELEDPGPFLRPATVLLTTGARFAADGGDETAEAYVGRLLDAGVTALGFAVGLHWDRVPAALVSACDRLRLPLFRVPYDTAFIEIAQTSVRLLDEQVRERDLWSLESQRAVTGASLHRDGLGAAVREAAARLGRWVCVTDRTGRVVEFAPDAARTAAEAEAVRREARRLVARGVGAARIEAAGTGMRLQSLGRRGRVLGVLAVEDRGRSDTAERALLGLVGALATLQLEHRSGVDEAQAALRSAIVQLLVAGELELARGLAETAAITLPEAPLVVIRCSTTETTDPEFLEDLASLGAGSPGLLRAARGEGGEGEIIIAQTRTSPAVRRLLAAYGVPAGVSERGAPEGLAALVEQAERAFAHAWSSEATAPVDYAPALHDGVLHLLSGHPAARQRAEGLLEPVRRHDERHGDRIEQSLAVWLAHHGQTSPAAAELGVHRHTLKARVQTAAGLLEADLDSPDTRAELWAALRFTSRA